MLIDGLNRFEDIYGASELLWLPRELPANARVVLSTLPGSALRELERRHCPTLDVQPLNPAERPSHR